MKKDYTVRVVYIVPRDAEPWEAIKKQITFCLEDIQWFFADEMSRHGYGPKSFEIARDNDGSVILDRINCTLTKSEFEISPCNKSKGIAEGRKLRSTNDIVIYLLEDYSFPKGKNPSVVARGAQRGFGGEAFLSSFYVKLAIREWISNDMEYGGKVFDWIRPEPMSRDTLSWNGRGKKLGDVSGAAYGIMAHELGHAFGLHHDRNDDSNRRGNLMGNGCRGMRGYFRPDLTNDFCVLTKKDTAHLNGSRFFSKRNLKKKSLTFGS